MKIKSAVLFFLTFSFCQAQTETLTLQLPKDTIKTTSSSLSALTLSPDKVYDLTDSSTIGLIAYLSSQYENHVDSLTFNSTGDLISSIDGVTVTLDGGTNVKIGNYVRFGSPTEGTGFTIVDTGASSAVIVLDQACTASETDEFYIGCVGTLNDVTENGFDAIQSTGINQPMTMWMGTDSVRFYLNGISFYWDLGVVLIDSLSALKNWSIVAAVNVYAFSNYSTIISSAISSSDRASLGINHSGFGCKIVYDGSTTNKGKLTSTTGKYYLTCTLNSGSLRFFYNGIEETDDNAGAAGNVAKTIIAGSNYASPVHWFYGELFEIKIYNRAISQTEITTMYENSIIYEE